MFPSYQTEHQTRERVISWAVLMGCSLSIVTPEGASFYPRSTSCVSPKLIFGAAFHSVLNSLFLAFQFGVLFLVPSGLALQVESQVSKAQLSVALYPLNCCVPICLYRTNQLTNMTAESKTATTNLKEATEQRIPLAYMAHLEPPAIAPYEQVSLTDVTVHPAVLRTALQILERKIVGTNRRTVAMLMAFKRLLEDYEIPRFAPTPQHLRMLVNKHIVFFRDCRPHNLSMGNVIKWLKDEQLKEAIEGPDLGAAVAGVVREIVSFVQERIVLATETIVHFCVVRILKPGDVILVFGRSTAVERTLLRAKEQGLPFSVVVVDSVPLREGTELARVLKDAGVRVTLTTMGGLYSHCSEVNRILLGAVCLTSNGNVLGRAGSAVVAMVAKQRLYGGAPPELFVLCESYKLSERVLIDSSSINDLEDPSSLFLDHYLNTDFDGPYEQGWSRWLPKSHPALMGSVGVRDSSGRTPNAVVPLYDVTPARCVDYVIMELGLFTVPNLPSVIRDYDSWRQGRRV